MNNPKHVEGVIFVGSKPFMNYVTGVVMQFEKGNQEVIVSSRGKFISKAVDVSEVARRRFLKDKNVIVKEVKIDSQEFDGKDGKKIFVSTMDIILKKEQ